MKKLLMPLAALLLFINPIDAQKLENIDEVASFSEGLAGVRKGDTWGFIDREGNLVIDFRSDVFWQKEAVPGNADITGVSYPRFVGGKCLISKMVEDGVRVFGFIDRQGRVVLEPSLLNVYPYKNGYTTGVLFEKTLRGQNEFKLNIYDYRFFDVLINPDGEITEYFDRRYGIQMTRRRYKRPWIGAKVLSDQLVAVYRQDQGWEISSLSARE